MDVDLIFKIAAVGIVVTVLNQMLTALAGVIVVLLMLVQEIKVLFDTVKSVFGL